MKLLVVEDDPTLQLGLGRLLGRWGYVLDTVRRRSGQGDAGGHSGLGLAITRSIAQRHGGELRLGESRPGRCVLVVELPTG